MRKTEQPLLLTVHCFRETNITVGDAGSVPLELEDGKQTASPTEWEHYNLNAHPSVLSVCLRDEEKEARV